jgi:hypothetical protein
MFSYQRNPCSENIQIDNMSKKLNAFWKKQNYTYPFTFKQTQLMSTNNSDYPFITVEKFQYNFKRVNPNQVVYK